MKKYIELLKKYKEVILYLTFGLMTTIVNFITYYLSAKVCGVEEVLSSAISWFVAVLFAYITNKKFVFNSQVSGMKNLLKEIGAFFSARILSGILCDVGAFAFMVKVLKINDIVSKIVTQVAVIILNYILSKKMVFKNKNGS